MASVHGQWHKLPLTLAELCIDTTLRCGQSFRWRNINDAWHCALHGRILSLKQTDTHLHYRATWPACLAPTPLNRPRNSIHSLAPPTPPRSTTSSPAKASSRSSPNGDATDDENTADLLQSYFALHHSLPALYTTWGDLDPVFARHAPSFGGIRILSQDAWEALICFICSSNNNIPRIALMVSRLCAAYGPLLGSVEGEEFYDFPSPETLAGEGVEERLRELGFGYRAKYVAETARMVARGEVDLAGLRNPASPAPEPAYYSALAPPIRQASSPRSSPSVEDEDGASSTPTYKAAHASLLALAGVGPKVADCACLMGLGWGEAVPVDTHVWQIAVRDYKFRASSGTSSKSAPTMNKALYDAVGDFFRDLWGAQAGWAHSVLFTADLRAFADRKADVKTKSAVKAEQYEEAASTVVTITTVGEETKRPRRRTTEAKVRIKVEKDAAEVELKGEVAITSSAGKDRIARVSRKRQVNVRQLQKPKREAKAEPKTDSHTHDLENTASLRSGAKRRRITYI